MEDLFLTVQEHKVLKRCKIRLEKRYGVQIFMPDVDTSSSLTEVIFASIYGERQNIDSVKKFVSKTLSRRPKMDDTGSNDIIIVTLSDSEEDPIANLDSSDDSLCAVEPSFNSQNRNLSTSLESQENSICIIESSTPSSFSKSLDDSVCIIESSSPIISTESSRDIRNKNARSNRRKYKGSKGNGKKKVSHKTIVPSTCGAEDPEFCEVTSTTEEPGVMSKCSVMWDLGGSSGQMKCTIDSNSVLHKEGNQPFVSVVLKKPRLCENTQCSAKERCDAFKPLPDFISLRMSSQTYCKENAGTEYKKNSNKMEQSGDDIIILDEPAVENEPEVKKLTAPRRLRPIVIDGSNVAREHGKVPKTFSSKGIQLCVEYFLNRGHTQVTAFVPKYRKHGDRLKFFPTTDQSILEDLEKLQHVVFTPSRKVQGQCISSYDDRFIVQLASKNGGVIVSNDNFKDLIDENESFREAIEKRLLMFCFVGDEFMVPNDPLGRNGPKLEDYLSFPPDENSEPTESSKIC